MSRETISSLEMLELLKNKKIGLYIFSRAVTWESLPASVRNFKTDSKEPLSNSTVIICDTAISASRTAV